MSAKISNKAQLGSMIIAVEAMSFYAYHGYYAEEQIIGANYQVSVWVHLQKAASSIYTLADTLNYEIIYQLTKQHMQQNQSLLENLAHNIINAIYQAAGSAIKPHIAKVRVQISKLNPPLGGPVYRSVVEAEA